MISSDKKEIRLFEAFAGIGAQRRALENIADKMNWKIIPVGQIEWYINAMVAYQLIHEDFKIINEDVCLKKYNVSSDSKKPLSKVSKDKLRKNEKFKYVVSSIKNTNNYVDISKVKGKDIPKNIDIFTYSFPCQDLSIQGKQAGMNKTAKTRSSLLWQVGRLLDEASKEFSKEEMPKYLLMENVASIVNQKNIKAFKRWVNKLNKYGYKSKYWIIDSSEHGSAQKRKRAFCLSVRIDLNIDLPDNINKREDTKTLRDILVKSKDHKLMLNFEDYNINFDTKNKRKINKFTLENYTKFNSENYLYHPDGLGPTLTASGANSRIKIYDQKNVRYLSALECLKYMGFNKEDYLKIADSKILSDTNITFLAGNSISVEVLESIFKTMVF